MEAYQTLAQLEFLVWRIRSIFLPFQCSSTMSRAKGMSSKEIIKRPQMPAADWPDDVAKAGEEKAANQASCGQR